MVETRSGRRFAVLFFVAAFLVLLLGRWLQPVDHLVVTVAAPFDAAISGPANWVGNIVSGVVDGPRLRDENERLKRINAALVQRSIADAEARHENQIFKRMLNFEQGHKGLSLLTTRVIGTDPNSPSSNIFLNRGTRDHLVKGMTVLDQNGYFVGKITDLTSNAARVQLMLSPSSSVGAIDLRSRAGGLVEGQYDALPKFDLVPTRQNIKMNDLILTSGQYNLFPRGILLGQVISVEHRNVDVFQSAVIRPAADFSDLEMAMVVRNFVPTPPTKLLTSP